MEIEMKTVIIERTHPLTRQPAPLKITAEDTSQANINAILDHVRRIEGTAEVEAPKPAKAACSHVLAPLDAMCIHCGADMKHVDTRELNAFGTRIPGTSRAKAAKSRAATQFDGEGRES
jgi:hypothetical protein